MKIKAVAILLLALIAGGDLFSQASTLCNYKYRRRITIDPAKVSGSNDLTDFPMLLSITSDATLATTANGGHVENSSGYDIVFTKDDGVTLLSHELCAYTASTGALSCWIKIPTLYTSINTYIYMYYGRTGVTTDPSTSAVWSNGFVGVWHLDNSLVDDGPNALNGTNGGSANSTTAQIVSARGFTSSSNHNVNITPYNAAYDITSSINVSCWVRLTTGNADQKFAGNQDGSTGGYKFGVYSDNKIEFEIRTSGNSPFLSRSATGGSTLTPGTWYYVVGQYSQASNFIKTYKNGALDRNYVPSSAPVCGSSTGTLRFGCEPFSTTSANLNGILDEVRVANVVRSSDWVATEYDNQSSPSTFYSISAEPKLWDGSSSQAWNTNGNWTPSGVPVTNEDVIIPSVANNPTLNTSPSIGALWIQNNATLTLASTRTISVLFDILNCGYIIGNSGYVQLNTTTIQVQHISGTGTYSLSHLNINNQFTVSPTTQLNTSVQVNGTLNLNSGIVGTTTTNILALTATAVSTSGSSQCFISGPMSKTGSANFVFPVGKGQEWRRIAVSNMTSSATFRAEYFTSAYTNTSPVSSPMDNVSHVEFWQLDRTAGTTSAKVSLYWENVAYSGIDNCPDLTVAHWTGSTWAEEAATAVAGSTCSGSGTGTVTTTANVLSFSPFSFGSKLGTANPLPITVSEFSATCDNQVVNVNWTTYSQDNTVAFEVQRSSDGLNFKSIHHVDVPPNSPGVHEYAYVDDQPLQTVAYYRVAQIDGQGKPEYTSLVATSCKTQPRSLAVIPNPSKGQFKVVGLPKGRNVNIVNSLGQVVYTFQSTSSEESISLQEQGVYFVQVEGATESAKILVH